MSRILPTYSLRSSIALAAFQALVFSVALASNLPTLKEAAESLPVRAANFANLPLSFERNGGQVDAQAQFLAHGDGYSLFLTESGAVLSLGNGSSCEAKEKSASGPSDCPADASRDVIRMTLGNVRPSHATGEEKLPGKVNYFIGSDPGKWRTDLPTYAKVRYAGVYRGVDLVYYGNQRQLEYDFLVAPGADTTSIRLNFDGAKRLSIDSRGDLTLEGESGSATLRKPTLYQRIDGRQLPVSGSFRMIGANAVGFSVGKYDRTRPLIIDPVLVYSTYLGGSGLNGHGDQGSGIAVDASGDAYVVGSTYSTDFPVTVNAHQAQNSAALAGHGSTVFVTKFNATGTALLYSTYLGGTGNTSAGDFGYGIALDPSGNAYITGATYSSDFPVTCGAFQTANGEGSPGASSAFVAKLNSSGDGLAYSTYLGGVSASFDFGEAGQAIAVNAAGNAYVTGYTGDMAFPVTDGAFQTSFGGGGATPDAFVSELKADGTGLVYSTFLGSDGGNVGNYGNAIVLDSAGHAFVAGTTSSTTFPVTNGAYQSNMDGYSNAFVTEFSADGSSQVFSTYLGGSSPFGDTAVAIAVDGNGAVYVAGNTSSADFPLTAGVVEGASVEANSYFSGYGPGGYVTKLSADGTALQYSTLLEDPADVVSGLAVDGNGSVYVVGNSPAAGAGTFGRFQTTPGAIPVSPSAANSAFLVKLAPDASVFNYATLFGGTFADGAQAVALDGSGNAYMTGSSFSIDLPVSSGAFQTMRKTGPSKGSNAFVSKFSLASQNNQTAYPSPAASIGTSVTELGNGQIVYQCFGDGSEGSDTLTVTVSVSLNTDAFGPPPSGTMSYFDGTSVPLSQPVFGSWGSAGSFTFQDGLAFDAPPDGIEINWSASYSGDSNYQPSMTSGTISSSGCPTSNTVRRGVTSGAPRIQLHLTPSTGAVSVPSRLGRSDRSLSVQFLLHAREVQLQARSGRRYPRRVRRRLLR